MVSGIGALIALTMMLAELTDGEAGRRSGALLVMRSSGSD
jgi:hypothetical protein